MLMLKVFNEVHCNKGNTEKSAMKIHVSICIQRIYFQEAELLNNSNNYYERIIKDLLK